MQVTVFSPAKLNLFLAVTGRRADGYHDLVSVVAPLELGDDLVAEAREPGGASAFTLACDHPDVPQDDTNLVLKGAAAFVAATGWRGGAHFRLTKRIPPGAGLGGGSSNAVAALRALNRLADAPLDEARLAAVAAGLGSDCALFLDPVPSVMRGRGERVERLAEPAARRLRGRWVLVFKPSFGVGTPWAYGQMIARGSDYLPAAEAEARLARWIAADEPAEQLLFNNMEPAVMAKYPALPVLAEKLRRACGLAVRMSGSGSACFALLGEKDEAAAASTLIRDSWGSESFLQMVRLA